MGFGSYIAGVMLLVLAVVLVFFGIAVLLGFFSFVATNFVVPLGIGVLVVALVMFPSGWYLYKSSKPQEPSIAHD